ncbi:putative glycoside hydrolase [Sorangium sp. So ce1024]|uniref:putative glycoside hydrolase n=1 Tax=Sorangium sp. So ce1024 TaxID=3133327 RepID=UPI003F03AA55
MPRLRRSLARRGAVGVSPTARARQRHRRHAASPPCACGRPSRGRRRRRRPPLPPVADAPSPPSSQAALALASRRQSTATARTSRGWGLQNGYGSFGLGNPAHHPYETVHASLSAGWRRVAGLPGRIALLRSWIQAFDLDSSRPMRRYKYTPWHIREQIRAIEDAGCAGYAAWNPRSRYEEGAFVAARPGNPA